MKIKTVVALLCAAFPFLLVQGQAQPLRHSVITLPNPEYSLVYLFLPDPAHPGRSHWFWVLQKRGNSSSPGLGQALHAEVGLKSLDDPLLKAYVKRIPAGKSIGLGWQFKKSDLAHQAGLTSLQQLCASRKIGFHMDTWASSYYER